MSCSRGCCGRTDGFYVDVGAGQVANSLRGIDFDDQPPERERQIDRDLKVTVPGGEIAPVDDAVTNFRP